MSLALPLALQALLTEHADLQAWAQAHGGRYPRLVVGYRKPRTAQDWPFIALVVARDTRRLGTDPGIDSGAVALVCGVRHDDPQSDGSTGYAAVDALAEAVFSILQANPAVQAPGLLVAVQANQTDAILQHPHYELEHLVTYQKP